MKKKSSIKSNALEIVKVLSFIFSVFLLQKLLFIPLTKLSIAYWSEFDGDGLNEPWFLTTSFALFVVAIFVSFIYVKIIEKKDWTFIRLSKNGFLNSFSYGIFSGFIIVSIFTIIILITGDIHIYLKLESFSNIVIYSIIFIVSFFLMAVYEELLFRGYILKIIEERFNLITAIIISSLIFSLAHSLRPYFSIIAFSNIFLFGCILSIVCIYFNSLWAVIGLHFSWNFLLWFFNYPVSGKQYPNPFIHLEYNNYSIISGSKFGPEDSLLLASLAILLIVIIILKFRKRKLI